MVNCRRGTFQLLSRATMLVVLVGGFSAQAAENPPAPPASVQDVQYIGAQHLGNDRLQSLSRIRKGEPTNPQANERGRQAILREYQDDGRLFASVEIAEGAKASDKRVVYQIVEGPVVKTADVQFRGNETVDSNRLREVKRRTGVQAVGSFRPSAVEQDVKGLAEYCRELGLAGTRVTPEVVRQSGDLGRVVVVYHIVEKK